MTKQPRQSPKKRERAENLARLCSILVYLNDATSLRVILEEFRNENHLDMDLRLLGAKGPHSPFLAACRMGREECAIALLDAGLPADATWPTQESPAGALGLAAGEGAATLVAALIERGADIEQRDTQGATPLRRAASQGHLACVARLIALGADVNAANHSGSSPLDAALWKGSWPCAQALLEAGANPHAGSSESPLEGPAGLKVSSYTSEAMKDCLRHLAAWLERDEIELEARAPLAARRSRSKRM